MASLHYITSAMNSSKSANLLMCWHNYEERGFKVLVVKPKLDTRDGEYVSSRALDVKRKADIILDEDDVAVVYDAVRSNSYNVVLIDEANFLTKEQVDELSDVVDFLDVPVMAYGISTDFETNMFEGSKRLYEIRDKLQELKTICPHCGGNATVNLRLDENDRPVFDGDSIQPGNNYLPVCRKHYKELKAEYLMNKLNNLNKSDS